MKIIDWDKRGNLVRFYLGDDNETEYWGDDWNDAPYDCNAGSVYDEYIKGWVDVAFPFDYVVLEACEEGYYRNSPWCKEDFKNKKAPFLVAKKLDEDEYPWYYNASFMKVLADTNSEKYYFGEPLVTSGIIINSNVNEEEYHQLSLEETNPELFK